MPDVGRALVPLLAVREVRRLPPSRPSIVGTKDAQIAGAILGPTAHEHGGMPQIVDCVARHKKPSVGDRGPAALLPGFAVVIRSQDEGPRLTFETLLTTLLVSGYQTARGESQDAGRVEGNMLRVRRFPHRDVVLSQGRDPCGHLNKDAAKQHEQESQFRDFHGATGVRSSSGRATTNNWVKDAPRVSTCCI